MRVLGKAGATPLIAGLLCVATASNAYSASLERLADGRIVITALGERLAFREADAAHIGLLWPPYPCRPTPPRGVTLAVWRDDPEVIACLKHGIPDEFPPGSLQSITLSVSFSFQNGELYPRSGKRISDSLRGAPPLYPGKIEPSELPDPPRLFSQMFVSVSHLNRLFKVTIPTVGPPDSLGYQMHQIGKAPPFFTLPPERRLGHASRELRVACSDTHNATCSISLTSADKAVGVSLRWLGPSPRADWSMYDLVARKIGQSIFIDRGPSDIQ